MIGFGPDRHSAAKRESALEAELISLYRKIDEALPGKKRRIIQIAGLDRPVSVQDISYRLARVAAEIEENGVLLLSTDVETEAETEPSVKEPECQSDRYAEQTEIPGLWSGRIPRMGDGKVMREFFDAVRAKFGLVLISTEPVLDSNRVLSLTKMTDGVILVMEAEVTPQVAAADAIRKVELFKGNLLGIIFRKIPM